MTAFPDTLLETADLSNEIAIILPPEAMEAAVAEYNEVCTRPDEEPLVPEIRTWDLVDPERGVYESYSVTRKKFERVLMVWSELNGTYETEDYVD
jgi:hypothetical protein